MDFDQTRPSTGHVRLTDWGVLCFQGSDAAQFLHGQLTQDLLLLGPDQARLAGYCSAKGRLLANGVVWKTGADTCWMALPLAVLPTLAKRLQMFVLRAQVKISDVSADWALFGVVGEAAIPSGLPVAPWSRQDDDQGVWVRLYPAAGHARALCAVAQTGTPPVATLPLDWWHWLEVQSGLAWVTPPVADALVPQMLNQESVGGVNFKKGCYPGQEVVARSQFRGTLKRRAGIFHAEAAMTVGQEVFHDSDPEQACGTVVSAAAHPEQGWDGVVSLTVRTTEDGEIRLGSATGPLLTALPLPYALLKDI